MISVDTFLGKLSDKSWLDWRSLSRQQVIDRLIDMSMPEYSLPANVDQAIISTSTWLDLLDFTDGNVIKQRQQLYIDFSVGSNQILRVTPVGGL